MSEMIPWRFGTRVVFSDRWAGHVTGLEIDEAWEVLNLLVTDGLIRANTVKLPFDAAKWTSGRVVFAEATSTQAFARELQPVAAPARPFTDRTPISMPGTKLAGALINAASHRAHELLLSRGGDTYRVSVDQVTFSGKELLITVRGDALDRFYDDETIEDAVSAEIARSRAIPADESRAVEVSVRGGHILIKGNVRTRQALDTLKATAATVRGATGISIAAVDDATLEFAVAQALYGAGLARGGEIHPRSALGEVTLFGFGQGAEAAAEALRTAARVPGVRSVRDRIEVEAHAVTTA